MSDLVLHHSREVPAVQYAGFVARVDLLPKEVREQAAVKGVRRLALFAVVLAVLIVAVGYAVVSSVAVSSQAKLSAAQQQTVTLNQKQGEYQYVRAMQRAVEVAQAAATVGTATSIDWTGLMGHLVGALPADATVSSITISMQSPIASVAPREALPAVERIGDIQLVARGTDLTAFTAWLDALKADATFSAVDVTSATDQEGWQVSITASVDPSLTAIADATVQPEETGAPVETAAPIETSEPVETEEVAP